MALDLRITREQMSKASEGIVIRLQTDCVPSVNILVVTFKWRQGDSKMGKHTYLLIELLRIT